MLRVYRVYGGTRAPHALAVNDTAVVLATGGLALLPTETVYGIGVAVNAYRGYGRELPPEGSGYRRIFSLKRRAVSQTVPWLVSGVDALERYGEDLDERALALARAFWPGALTIVVRASRAVPAFLCAADGTVALRASASPVIQGLVRACESPLAVTSANTHGAPAPTSFAEVESSVLAGVDVAVDAGETPCADASTIVSCVGPQLGILRAGALSPERILAALPVAAQTQ